MNFRFGLEAGLGTWTAAPFSAEAAAVVFAAGATGDLTVPQGGPAASLSGTAGATFTGGWSPTDMVLTLVAGIAPDVPFQLFWDFDGATATTQTVVTPTISGTSSDELVFVFAQPASVWTLVHNLGRRLLPVVLNSAGDQIIGDVTFPDANTTVITFSVPLTGTAYVN